MATALEAKPAFDICGYMFHGPFTDPSRLPRKQGVLALIDISGIGDMLAHTFGTGNDIRAVAANLCACNKPQTPGCCLAYAYMEVGKNHYRLQIYRDILSQLAI